MKKSEIIGKEIKKLQIKLKAEKQRELENQCKIFKKQLKRGSIIMGDFADEDELSHKGKYRQILKFKIEGSELKWSQSDCPNIMEHCWDIDRIKIITDKKLIARLKKPIYKKELKLNDEYIAIVTKNNVKVGCQEFDHKIIKALYLLSCKAQKS